MSENQFGEVTRNFESLRLTKLFIEYLLHLDVFPSCKMFLVPFTVHVSIKSRTTGKLLEEQNHKNDQGDLSQTINYLTHLTHA